MCPPEELACTVSQWRLGTQPLCLHGTCSGHTMAGQGKAPCAMSAARSGLPSPDYHNYNTYFSDFPPCYNTRLRDGIGQSGPNHDGLTIQYWANWLPAMPVPTVATTGLFGIHLGETLYNDTAAPTGSCAQFAPDIHFRRHQSRDPVAML